LDDELVERADALRRTIFLESVDELAHHVFTQGIAGVLAKPGGYGSVESDSIKKVGRLHSAGAFSKNVHAGQNGLCLTRNGRIRHFGPMAVWRMMYLQPLQSVAAGPEPCSLIMGLIDLGVLALASAKVCFPKISGSFGILITQI